MSQFDSQGVSQDVSALVAREVALENAALDIGAADFRRAIAQAQLKGIATQQGGAKTLLVHAYRELDAALNATLSAVKRGKIAEGKKLLQAFVVEDDDLAALSMQAQMTIATGTQAASLLVCRVVLDTLLKADAEHRPVTAKALAKEIAKALSDELRARAFRAQAPELHKLQMKSFKTNSLAHIRRATFAVMRKAGVNDARWRLGEKAKLNVGTYFLNLFEDATGLLQYTDSAKTGSRLVELSERARTYIGDRDAALESLWPTPRPMVIKPLEWGKGVRGGYAYGLAGRFPLVRKLGTSKLSRIENSNMPAVFDAVNRLQETAWCVNTRVLEVAEELFARGVAIADLPPTEDQAVDGKPGPCPQLPPDLEAEYKRFKKLPYKDQQIFPLSPEVERHHNAFRDWKRRMKEWKDNTAKRVGKRRDVARAINLAVEMKDDAAFYFPYSLDYRGRAYPIVADLQPQGSDLAKGLLRFAEEKPLNDTAAMYLALHGANVMGETLDAGRRKTSKMTLDERAAWIQQNTALIQSIAADPLGNLTWADASEPFQFLAFCFEWAGYVQARDTGALFQSSLPVAVDGSCNALQLFSLLFQDEEAGRQVNCVPALTPQDIYSSMAEIVKDRLATAAAQDDRARMWMEAHHAFKLIDRSFCKQPVMTFGYGASRAGFSGQLQNRLREHKQFEQIKTYLNTAMGNGGGWVKACAYMADILWAALSDCLPIGVVGREWMRKMGVAIAQSSGQIKWKTPLGFTMYQRYYNNTRERADLVLSGKKFQPTVWTMDKTSPNVRKHGNSLSPNIIHSLDATAMMMTVNACAAQGVTAFAMVHDSYGTHAADMLTMAQTLRQCFYQMFSQTDLLAEMEQQLSAQVDEKHQKDLPDTPTKGTLPLDAVLESRYFFN